jgi:hypothetical protein
MEDLSIAGIGKQVTQRGAYSAEGGAIDARESLRGGKSFSNFPSSSRQVSYTL